MRAMRRRRREGMEGGDCSGRARASEEEAELLKAADVRLFPKPARANIIMPVVGCAGVQDG